MSLALPEALFFTGIDWAAETHAVCVLDAAGKIAAGFTIEHSADGIAALIRRLALRIAMRALFGLDPDEEGQGTQAAIDFENRNQLLAALVHCRRKWIKIFCVL